MHKEKFDRKQNIIQEDLNKLISESEELRKILTSIVKSSRNH